ncbi:MAG: hypothetical protein Q7U16_12975 [Agitococcus sp.]|nr:hypothetical protein [Agitococcus sp.]
MPTPIDVPTTFHRWFAQKVTEGLFKEKHRERAYSSFSAGCAALMTADQLPQVWCWSLPSGLETLPREFFLLHDLETVAELRKAIDCAEDNVPSKPLFDLCVLFKYIAITY